MSATADRPPLARDPPRASVAAVGVSTDTICGVRDHAVGLAGALEEQGTECSLHWLWRGEDSVRATRGQMREWLEGLSLELENDRPDAVLLHYSIFTVSYRGFPVFVPSLLSTLREAGVPLIALMHEYAYPWHLGGWRGKAWAASHRVALLELMRTASAVAVTEENRARWLRSRRWLPARPTELAPVFANVPRASETVRGARPRPLIGLFGFVHEGIERELVLAAMRLLQEQGVDAQLTLLGAPGEASPAGEQWLARARALELAQPPTFSGTLPAQELANALAACDVLICADRLGPTSRRTTLAASLASGRPVVAIEGRHTWRLVREQRAAQIVPASGDGIATAVAQLLRDPRAGEELGASGAAFAEEQMSARHSAQVVRALLAGLAGAAA
jgi:glycosyltransferase involved in cell wall biosynthesis